MSDLFKPPSPRRNSDRTPMLLFFLKHPPNQYDATLLRPLESGNSYRSLRN